MRSFFRWMLVVLSLIVTVYRFRYRGLNFITKVPGLRRWLVRSSMNIPWLRQKLMSKMFQIR
ncbi:hypothetical protein MUN89_11010 [Halobacillus salinarum]|uniref:Uncharacterized protein n=1 Tax=Halobacillus salinarum TaxID=2932257 RepID=A0ABY4EDJ2_9BACI|nr:hypothetical protein [Halobacillus salinarum]UOQ42518.1 hypothetical protein MUN89_11010 [Halobacillus salinarum]